MSERHWTQEHYVTRNSTTDDPSGYRVWLTCRCGWDSGTLPDGNLPTTHRAELEHYVSGAPAEPAVTRAKQAIHVALASRWMTVANALMEDGDEAYEVMIESLAVAALGGTE